MKKETDCTDSNHITEIFGLSFVNLRHKKDLCKLGTPTFRMPSTYKLLKKTMHENKMTF